MRTQFRLSEGYPALYGAAPPLVLLLSDDEQVHQELGGTLTEHGFEVQGITWFQLQTVLDQLHRRPQVMIVDTFIEPEALRAVAAALESHHLLKDCALIGLGSNDKVHDVRLHFHHRWRFPCEPAEILRLVTHALERHAPSAPTNETLMKA
jgi:DNA-binding NtrC family response regulator